MAPSFLDLPREIQDKIFEGVIPPSVTIDPSRKWETQPNSKKATTVIKIYEPYYVIGTHYGSLWQEACKRRVSNVKFIINQAEWLDHRNLLHYLKTAKEVSHFKHVEIIQPRDINRKMPFLAPLDMILGCLLKRKCPLKQLKIVMHANPDEAIYELGPLWAFNVSEKIVVELQGNANFHKIRGTICNEPERLFDHLTKKMNFALVKVTKGCEFERTHKCHCRHVVTLTPRKVKKSAMWR